MGAMKHMSLEATLVTAASDGKPVPGTEHEIAILFNRNVISPEEVNALLDRGADLERDPRVIVTTPAKMRAFRDGVLTKGDA